MKKLFKQKHILSAFLKWNLKMKITALFLFVSFFQIQANTTYGQDVKITLDIKNQTLDNVLFKIEKLTAYKFMYNDNDINYKRKISIKAKNDKLSQVLSKLFNNTGVTYEVLKKQIILKKDSKLTKKQQTLVNNKTITKLQDITISGTVTDTKSIPLPGANIIEKGTSNGTQTDFDGNFSLKTSSGSCTLVVSYLGYITQEISVNNNSKINIQLQESENELEEVIVYGYGSSTKEKFNGSVSKVKSKEINNYSSANFEQALAGTISGVQISSNGKNGGENSVIQIRGLNTLTAGTNPLIVVDGNPLSEGSSLSSINTKDIESVNVLKDAASAAIYGSRASNGVILITTKKGKKGDLKVTFDTYYGVQNRIDNFQLTDAYDTALFDNDARNFGYISGGTGRNITDSNITRDANGGGKRSRIQDFLPNYLNNQSGLTNTNWLNEVFRTASQQNHYLNLSGGTENTGYSISFGYLNQENIIIDSDYKRYTTNIKIDSQISDRIRFGISSNLSLANSNPTGEAGWSNYGIGNRAQPDPAFSVILMHPYYPVYNADGSYAIAHQVDDNNNNWDGPISENTVAQTKLTHFSERRFRVFGNTYFEFEPWDNLKYKTSFGGDYNSGFTEFFAPSNIGNYRTPVASNFAQGFENNARRENFIFENTLNYSNTFNLHNVDILVGHSYQEENYFQNRLESKDFADNNITNLGGATNSSGKITRSNWALESYFSRIQYSFDSRYSLSVSYRRDGSSRFGANTKQGDFASLSAGWTLSNESFFPEDGLVNFTKLRASWGQTGNNQIGDYSSLALVKADNYTVNGNVVAGAAISTSPNANLSWETNSALNLGLDLGLLDNKLFITAEYYKSNTKDLLLDVPVPQQSGYSESLQNIGELENKGIELEIKGNRFKIGNVNLGFNANITTNTNKVLALGKGQKQIIQNNGGMDFLTKVGEGIAQFYAYDIVGVYRDQTQIDNDAITPLSGTEVGDYVVRDADGNGKITPDDRVVLGDYNPDFTYGFGLNIQYKNFDFNAQFSGVEGRKAADRMVYFAESGEGFFVPTKHYYNNYYNDRNPDGFFRRPDFSSFSSAGRLTRSSSLSILDADYFRLRSMQIGYTLPKEIIDHLNIDHLRLYLTGNNIFNITKYRGYNADGLDTRGNRNQTLTRGWIQSTSPLTRFMAFGLNVKF